MSFNINTKGTTKNKNKNKNKMTFFKVKQIQFMEIYRNVLYRIYSIDIFILFKSYLNCILQASRYLY
jgi:hypothetical protein